MASNKDNPETWIQDETYVHENEGYGGNQQAVEDALGDQQKRVQMVKEYSKEVPKKDGPPLKEKYEDLSVLAEKRLACLQDMSQITKLEEIFGNASTVVSARAAALAKKEMDEKQDDGNVSTSVARAAQSCIFAVQDNWSWIAKLVKCVDIHLKHAAEYHQFFHELKESDLVMRNALGQELDKLREEQQQKQQDPQKMLVKVKELLTLFLHWQHKTDEMFERSKSVLPVHLRTAKLDYYRPVKALCGYRTRQIDIHEGEELTLMDNSKPLLWKVHNLRDVEASVPSVILLIPGPDPDAINLGNRLRLQLLGMWTQYLKEIGRSIFAYLLIVFKEKWSDDETKKLKAMPDDQKDSLRRIMRFIENYFSTYWSAHPDYLELVQRFNTLRKIIDQQGNEADRDLKFGSGLINQLTTSEQVLERYKDYWTNWETYKIMLETSRHPQYMLFAENWEQLGFYEVSEILRKWHLGIQGSMMTASITEPHMAICPPALVRPPTPELPVCTRGEVKEVTMVREDMKSGKEGSASWGDEESCTMVTRTETTTVSSSGVESAVTKEDVETTSSEWSTAETAETDQLMRSEQEEKKTFVITGVKDPRTDEEVSMKEAIRLGIINNNEGTYVNLKTKETIPIPEAMNRGLILVEFVSSKKTKEKKQDIGLITIKTMKESRPYSVHTVVDAKTDQHLTVDEAIEQNILDQNKGVYIDKRSNTEMSLADAIDSGLLLVDIDETAEVGMPQQVVKTYAIHGVVDAKRKIKVTFSQAVRLNLLDKETGAYTNNATGQKMYVGDAIKKGFVKATVVKDPSSLDIDPENKMVVEKLDILRKKLLKPMIAIAALRKAAVTPSSDKKVPPSSDKKTGATAEKQAPVTKKAASKKSQPTKK